MPLKMPMAPIWMQAGFKNDRESVCQLFW